MSAARVNVVLKWMGLSVNHTGEKVRAAKRTHGWEATDVFKKARTSAKKGGEAAWVAKEKVLKQMFENLK